MLGGLIGTGLERELPGAAIVPGERGQLIVGIVAEHRAAGAAHAFDEHGSHGSGHDVDGVVGVMQRLAGAAEQGHDLAVVGVGERGEVGESDAAGSGTGPFSGLSAVAASKLDDEGVALDAGGGIDDVQDLAVGRPAFGGRPGRGTGGFLDLLQLLFP